MEYLLKTPDNQWICSTSVFWTGDCSTVSPRGALVEFLLNTVSSSVPWFYMPRADGDVCQANVLAAIQKHGGTLDDIQAGRVWVGTLSQRFPVFENAEWNASRVIYMPQDDNIFQHGLTVFFERFQIPWDEKRPVVFWRGSCSADFKNGEFLRRDVVAALQNHPACDVKLVKNWHEGKEIPETFFADPKPIPYFLQHKYLLILDGNGLSSNHTWPFASGSVPVIVSNCRFWFESHLVPYKNYVPVRYDLSNLVEVIDWLVEHDAEAKAIAEGALELARMIFTPEFQHDYLRGRLQEQRN
jgi:hypothetical protein